MITRGSAATFKADNVQSTSTSNVDYRNGNKAALDQLLPLVYKELFFRLTLYSDKIAVNSVTTLLKILSLGVCQVAGIVLIIPIDD